MLKIEKFVTMSPEQYDIVIEGMRNPKNSWDRMDSGVNYRDDGDCETEFYDIGPNDHALMESLNNGGPVHAKYRRMMPVWATIIAPLYWWKEFDTYKVGTVTNSCSTMHKIQAKEFTMNDFSTEQLFGIHEFYTYDSDKYFPKFEEWDGEEKYWTPTKILEQTISSLNFYRERFLDTQAVLKPISKLTTEEQRNLNIKAKLYWWQMIQLLPTSYNQKRTVEVNYEVLHNIYIWRRKHKLDEWHTFCDWIEELPYSELITMEEVR